jgi:hypothetical protein
VTALEPYDLLGATKSDNFITETFNFPDSINADCLFADFLSASGIFGGLSDDL